MNKIIAQISDWLLHIKDYHGVCSIRVNFVVYVVVKLSIQF